MHPTAILAAFAFTAGISATPVPANVDAPISDAEWQALRDGGLKVRSAQSTVNQAINDAEWQALEDGGLSRREDAASIFKRDKVMNCGHRITGKGGSNGHGKWIPVQQFSDLADKFCKAYTGTDIAKGHETWDTYPITLTNQDNASIPGPPGNIVFAIYNTDLGGTYVVDHDTCLRAMKGPLGTHAPTRRDELVKRDNCWAHKHNDYEGGYYKIDGLGAFGSEVYQSS